MNVRYVSALFVSLSLLASVLACSKPAPPPPAPAIKYDITQGAEINKVTWYISNGVFTVEVTVKNTSTSTQKYDVSVNVDNEGYFAAGLEAKEVKAAGTLLYKTNATLSTPMPKSLAIRVAPVTSGK